MWSGPIARITKNSTNWPTANQAWRRLTSSCEAGKILTTVCALTKPWDTLLPRSSCSSGNANLKRQSVTNLLDEYSRLTPVGWKLRILGNKSSRWGGKHAPVQFSLSSLQEGLLKNSDNFRV